MFCGILLELEFIRIMTMMEMFAESLRNVNNCKIVSLVVSHCDSTLYTLNFKKQI